MTPLRIKKQYPDTNAGHKVAIVEQTSDAPT
jgi:hypothetical protein